MGVVSRSDERPFRGVFPASGFDYAVLGEGHIGGKAAGLRRALDVLERAFPGREFRGVEIGIPGFVVLATGHYEEFLARLSRPLDELHTMSDERIGRVFLETELPVELVGDLRRVTESTSVPLAVRSSSLLEDALERPFAGVYATKMEPNNQSSVDARFARLVEAVKLVYASAHFRAARDYARAIGEEPSREAMAVIIQAVAGGRYGERFYPVMSGVSRSFNHYPFGSARREEGVVQLALGLGKTIVDGQPCWTYSPAHPRQPPPFGSVKEMLAATQTRFWAVNMGRAPAYDPTSEAEYLVSASLAEAEYDDTLGSLASTLEAGTDRLIPGTGRAGARILNFAPVLNLVTIPLNDLLKEAQAACCEAWNSAGEMEFAVEQSSDGSGHRFALLQVRAMAGMGELDELEEEASMGPPVVACADALGHGVMRGVRHLVYVRPTQFDRARTRTIAREVGQHNRALVQAGCPYVLVGFGRWGSTDPWLGIPVVWGDVGGACCIVEAPLADWAVDMSQGAHFFHNLTALGVSYFSVGEGAGTVDWNWLNDQEAVFETEHVRTVRLSTEVTVRVDGKTGAGSIDRL